MTRPAVLLLAAIVFFVFAAFSGEADDGEVLLTAVSWLGLGGAAMAGSFLPPWPR